ncbi:MAG: NYN domain-containing protein [Phycisphaerae bacterium]
MPLLVDAYNLMHALQACTAGSERIGRAWMCRLLGQWAERCEQRVTVVFDGRRPDAELASQLADDRIKVAYSGRRTADDLLADLIGASSAPRRLLVVSSDREVQRSARRRRAPVMRSEDFARRLLQQPPPREESSPADTADKPPQTPPEGSDEWMRTFGYDPEQDAPFEHP